MADSTARTRPLSDPADRAVQIRPNLSSRDGTLAKDGRIYNGYIEDGAVKRVRRRPGLTLGVSALGLGQGMTVVGDPNVGYVVAGNTIYTILTRYTTTNVTATNYSFSAVLGSTMFAIDSTASGTVSSVAVPALTYTSVGSVGVAINDMSATSTRLVVTSGSNQLRSSPDGITWTLSGTIFTNCPRLGTRSDSTRTYLFGSSIVNGATYFWTEDYGVDGGFSDTFVTPATIDTPSIGYHNGAWWAVNFSTGATYTSADFKTWTQTTASSAVTGGPKRMVSYGNLLYVIANSNAVIYSTAAGITWENVGTATNVSGTSSSYLSVLGTRMVYTAGNKTGYLRLTSSVSSGVTVGSVSFGIGEQIDLIQNTGSTKVLIKGTNIAYVLTVATNTVTQVTDVDYPAVTVRGVAYLDGTFYVMEPDGTIWGSDIDDPSSWSALNFLNAEMEPDGGVCIAKYLNYVLAFGQWTTQLFWDAANPTGSPLNAVQNGILLIGCAHGNSVAQIESTLLWIAQRKGSGSTSQKGRFIAMMEGTNYVPVSTPDVDRILDADDLTAVYSCALAISGHLFYLLSLGATGATLVYDLQAKAWYVWTRRTASSAKTISSLTQTNGLATATSTSHGFSDGDFVVMSGATQSGYNLSIPITVIDANTFTYPVASATVSPATGSPIATGSTEAYFDMASSVNLGGNPVVLDAGTGAVWTVDPTVFTDNSQPIDFRIRTNNIDQGNNERKFCSSVAAIADLTSSSQTGLLRNSDDDFQTWSLFRRFDLSQVRANAQRWGNYRRRAWEWRFNGTATDHRLEALEAEIEQGNS